MKIESNRAGLSLVEVIVTMTLLAVVLTSLASMSYTAARRSVVEAGTAYRHGVMLQEVNRMMTVPYANLMSQNGCVTVPTGAFPHRRCVVVTGSTEQVTVTIRVQPGLQGVRPDTVVFQRARFILANPLNS